MEEPKVIGTRGIWCAKKLYLVQLKNKAGDIAFHARCKGVPSDCIVKRANQMFPHDIQCEYRDGLAFPIPSVSSNEEYSIWHLYKSIYDGQMIEFEKLHILVRSCKQSNPFDAENFYAFVEISKSDNSKIFSNWMDRNNPGKRPVQNADYDVWLVRCE